MEKCFDSPLQKTRHGVCNVKQIYARNASDRTATENGYELKRSLSIRKTAGTPFLALSKRKVKI